MQTLEAAEAIAERLAETAEEVDRSFEPPKSTLTLLAQAGYFRAQLSAQSGFRRRILDRISSGCGATAFLASQQVGALRRMARVNHRLVEPGVEGSAWIGVCFAHLRRRPSPVEVREFDGKLIYRGTGPWFSGFGLMEGVLVAGATSEGRFLMAYTPVQQAGIEPGVAPELAVMNATSTVPLEFHDLEIPTHEQVMEYDADSMHLSDRQSTADQSARSLGVSRAAARFLNASASRAVLERIEELHIALDRWEESPSWEGAVALRKESIELSWQTVRAALVSVGGRAHTLAHPVQRLAREASFYTTAQLTAPLREAFVEELFDGD